MKLGIILFTTVLAFSTLYIPQPILPLLAVEFGVTETEAALLTAVTFVPLGLAPILYGYFADAVSAKGLLRFALAGLTVSQALIPLFDGFWWVVTLRFVQGLFLPAIFTGLVTYTANTARADRVRSAVSFYIAATILGGFSGRFLGGLVSELLAWRWAFGALALALAFAFLLTARLPGDTRPAINPIEPRIVQEVWSWPGYARAYVGLLLIFGVFASVLNFVPFRLKQIDSSISELTISLIYAGYLTGAVIALLAPKISALLGGEMRGMLTGVGLLGTGVATMTLGAVPWLFAGMFILCGGFFLFHSLLSAFLNHHAPHGKGVVNGLYISFYYSGGALGAYLPGFIFRNYGWSYYLLCLGVVLVIGTWALLGLMRAHTGKLQHPSIQRTHRVSSTEN